MDMQKIQNLTRCSGLKSKSDTPKIPLKQAPILPYKYHQPNSSGEFIYRKLKNTVVSLISRHRWCLKICLLIGGVHFLESWAILVLSLKI